MGWFSGSNSSKASSTHSQLPSTEIEQRSHQPLNLSSEISQTLSQISNSTPPNIEVPEANPQDSIKQFVDERPNNVFIIDGEKDIKESIICTNNSSGGKTCLKLGINSIEIFKTMQKLGYFCSLPDDVDATYFECRKIA